MRDAELWLVEEQHVACRVSWLNHSKNFDYNHLIGRREQIKWLRRCGARSQHKWETRHPVKELESASNTSTTVWTFVRALGSNQLQNTVDVISGHKHSALTFLRMEEDKVHGLTLEQCSLAHGWPVSAAWICIALFSTTAQSSWPQVRFGGRLTDQVRTFSLSTFFWTTVRYESHITAEMLKIRSHVLSRTDSWTKPHHLPRSGDEILTLLNGMLFTPHHHFKNGGRAWSRNLTSYFSISNFTNWVLVSADCSFDIQTWTIS